MLSEILRGSLRHRTKEITKMSKNRAILGYVGHSGFDQQNTIDFSSFVVNFFDTVTLTSHQSYEKRTLVDPP